MTDDSFYLNNKILKKIKIKIKKSDLLDYCYKMWSFIKLGLFKKNLEKFDQY